MIFEVKFYTTEENFNKRQSSETVSGLSKSAACAEAVNQLGSLYYKIAKIQSDDREEIFIIKNHD